MDTFWIVTLFHFGPSKNDREAVEFSAINDFGTLGIEEFSLSEPEVDALLGERSYSGGDLPDDVLDEVENRVLGVPANLRFFFNDEKSAKGFQKMVASEQLCETQLEECPQQDWNAEWKKHYSPIRVNDLLEVVPAWEKAHQSTSRKQIFIHPGMGFGTGSHETTFLCLKLFTEELLGEKITEVLDFGSGSGILGLSSFLFFPDAKVDFYDIDPEANKNCFHNAEINGLKDKAFRLLLPEVREKLKQKYQIVFANILESILLEEKKFLVAHTEVGGYLVLSGLLKHQVPGIIEAYVSEGMVLKRNLEKGDWGALLLKKENP